MKTYFNPHLLFSVFIDFTSDRPFLVLLYYPGTVAKKKRGALRPRPRARAAPALANLNSTASKSNNLLLCILLWCVWCVMCVVVLQYCILWLRWETNHNHNRQDSTRPNKINSPLRLPYHLPGWSHFVLLREGEKTYLRPDDSST